MAKLLRLSEEWIGRKVADYDDEKLRIAEIFERVNEARIHFGVRNICFHMWYLMTIPLFSLRLISASSRLCM